MADLPSGPSVWRKLPECMAQVTREELNVARLDYMTEDLAKSDGTDKAKKIMNAFKKIPACY
ncbi:MAG: hypothetical protein ACLQIQ_12380 [Beijerinckiaceae bacterium]